MSQPQPPNAPPAYDDVEKYPNMYPDANATAQQQQGAPYQPNMTNPYPPNAGPGLQQPPHQPQQQQPSATTTTYVYVNEQQQAGFGPRPQNAFCPNCRQHVLTNIKYNAGLLTWLLFGGCLLFGCWMGCCLIPFCCDDCQDCEHYCSNCKAYLGQYKRL